jgi:hypothetical protein
VALPTEETSRLWTAFQAKYRPTVAYQASVVLIESRRPARAALPVRERNLYVVPLETPVLEKILSQAGAGEPAVENQPILAGQTLVLRGQSLRGDVTLVNVNGVEATPAVVEANEIQVPLPATLAAGLLGVQVLHLRNMGTPPAPHRGVQSNVLPFLLRPRITGVAVGGGNLTLTVAPLVGATQRVNVLLNETGVAAPRVFSISVPSRVVLADPPAPVPGPAATVAIPLAGIGAGTYLVRVQVDGAESPVEGNFTGPLVVIP